MSLADLLLYPGRCHYHVLVDIVVGIDHHSLEGCTVPEEVAVLYQSQEAAGKASFQGGSSRAVESAVLHFERIEG